MLRIFVFIALSLSFTLSASAQDAGPEPAGYQDAIQMAVEEFSAGQWAEARALFQKAHGLMPNARTFRGLGMTNFELREYIDALGYLNAALNDTRKALTEEQKKQTQELIDRARLYVAQFQITLTPPEATVMLNRAPVDVSSGWLFLKIGDYELTARAPGYDDLVMNLKVQGGENLTLPLVLQQTAQAAAPVAVVPAAAPVVTPPPATPTQPAPPAATASSSGPSAWAWVTAGGALAFVGAGVALTIHSNNSYEKLEDLCSPVCSEQQKDDSGVALADTLKVASFITAGALATTSVLLFVFTGGGEESASAPSARLGIGPGAVQFSGRF
jgi:tetratricopeptide (TPR) repeat protein